MSKKGCNCCDNYQIGKLNVWKDDEPSKCKIGNDVEFKSWWDENGKKIDDNTLTDMPCFKETKSGEMLKTLSELLGELKNKI